MENEMGSEGIEEVSTELLISAYWKATQLELDLNFIQMIADELLHRGIQINSETE
ncbi:sporulation histidine kinase inhibitor Sda [Paenibacillus sp. FSL R5-0345]|uniref:sporulation histidine kinase inhibitor Sda n=1 Tax=Paenibacillus sp. FSL R5-0345 TaxID=1536770 RepID=UPI0009E054F4|nr:sporulation histidine kinase inhibitor Sda [Paenibacillus sp. FSL R5-0345]